MTLASALPARQAQPGGRGAPGAETLQGGRGGRRLSRRRHVRAATQGGERPGTGGAARGEGAARGGGAAGGAGTSLVSGLSCLASRVSPLVPRLLCLASRLSSLVSRLLSLVSRLSSRFVLRPVRLSLPTLLPISNAHSHPPPPTPSHSATQPLSYSATLPLCRSHDRPRVALSACAFRAEPPHSALAPLPSLLWAGPSRSERGGRGHRQRPNRGAALPLVRPGQRLHSLALALALALDEERWEGMGLRRRRRRP